MLSSSMIAIRTEAKGCVRRILLRGEGFLQPRNGFTAKEELDKVSVIG